MRKLIKGFIQSESELYKSGLKYEKNDQATLVKGDYKFWKEAFNIILSKEFGYVENSHEIGWVFVYCYDVYRIRYHDGCFCGYLYYVGKFVQMRS